MARLYDPMVAATERRCLAAWRRRLLGDVDGEVLEIGAGTGVNLDYYPGTVRRLHLVEPEPAMRRRLAARLASAPAPPHRVIEQGAETLPCEDTSIDHVVSTLVLCSVEDLTRSLAELHRVLRPGGTLRFMEHVVARENPRLARWQHRVEPLWRWCAGNCHLTRDTAAAIDAAGFSFHTLEHVEMAGAPPFVRPMVLGVARRPPA